MKTETWTCDSCEYSQGHERAFTEAEREMYWVTLYILIAHGERTAAPAREIVTALWCSLCLENHLSPNGKKLPAGALGPIANAISAQAALT